MVHLWVEGSWVEARIGGITMRRSDKPLGFTGCCAPANETAEKFQGSGYLFSSRLLTRQ